MQPYKPSNKAPLTGVLLLFFLSIICGILLGLLTFAISNFIYLILLFPMGLGLIGGIITSVGVDKGKVRSPILGGLFGLLLGLLIYGSFRYAEYDYFRKEGQEMLLQEMEQELGYSDVEVANDFIDEVLIEETGSKGFLGFLKLTANEGTSFERLFRSQSIELGAALTWIYWFVELIIIAGVSMFLGHGAAIRPFCETCQEWFKPKRYLGSVEPENSKTLIQAIQSENFTEVGMLMEEDAVAPCMNVSVQECQCEVSDSILVIDRASINRKGKVETKTILNGFITPSQRAILTEYEVEEDGEIEYDATPQEIPNQEEKDYTRTRIILITLILMIVLPICLAFGYSIVTY